MFTSKKLQRMGNYQVVFLLFLVVFALDITEANFGWKAQEAQNKVVI